MLTFDDGPLPPYTNRVLDMLAENCVKANYFLVGRMARGYPDLARRIRAEGHTIGTHSENHLLGFDHASMDTVKSEIEQGIVSVGRALDSPRAVSPFFRIPASCAAARSRPICSPGIWRPGAPTWWPTTGGTSTPPRWSAAPSPGSTNGARACCCCTTSSRRPRWLCPNCCAN